MNTTLKNNSGLSLIEISIIMVIFGLLFVPSLRAIQVKHSNEVIRKSDDRINVLVSALQRYAIINGRYPRPANRNLPPGDVLHGQEAASTPSGSAPNIITSLPNCESGFNDSACRIDNVLIGALPIDALSIPLDMMIDGYGGQFTYAVTELQTDVNNFMNGTEYQVAQFEGAGAITVADTNGDPLPDADGNVHFFIFSHGKNQEGTYSIDGIRKEPCDASSGRDQDNCLNENAVFTDNSGQVGAGDNIKTVSIHSYVDGVKYFDDYAGWATNTVYDVWSRVISDVNSSDDVDIFTRMPGNIAIGYFNDLRLQNHPLEAPVARVEVNGNMRILETSGGGGGHLLLDRICEGNDLTYDGNGPIPSNISEDVLVLNGYNRTDENSTNYVFAWDLIGNGFAIVLFKPRRNADFTIDYAREPNNFGIAAGTMVPQGWQEDADPNSSDNINGIVLEDIENADGILVEESIPGLVRYDAKCEPRSPGDPDLARGVFKPGVFHASVETESEGLGISCNTAARDKALNGVQRVDEKCDSIPYNGPDFGGCDPGEIAIGVDGNGNLTCTSDY